MACNNEKNITNSKVVYVNIKDKELVLNNRLKNILTRERKILKKKQRLIKLYIIREFIKKSILKYNNFETYCKELNQVTNELTNNQKELKIIETEIKKLTIN